MHRLMTGIGSVTNALLGAFAAIVAAAIVSWIAGAPISVLASLASSAALGVLAVFAVRGRLRYSSHQRIIRSYLDAPDLGPSRFLPVGPTAKGTPVGQIVTRRSLLVRKHWHRLADPSRTQDADSATIAAEEVAAGGKVMIVGEPGIGKSLTISRIFQRLATRYLSDPRHVPIPVFVHLGEVTLTENIMASEQGILNVVARHTH